MKHTFFVFALGLLLTACNRQDEHIAKQITGTWTQTAVFESMTNYVTAVFSPDHNFSVTRRMSDRTNYSAGTWQVEGNVVLMTDTNRFADNVVRIKIDDLKHDHFLYRDVFLRYGPTNTFYRQ